MREVTSHHWAAFCDRLNENERGGTLSLHKIEPSGLQIEIARNLVFEGIEFGKRDDCNDRMLIRSSGELSRYEIVEPIHVKLMESEGGTAFPGVVIEAEDGVTLANFHPVIKAAWLEGLDVR